MGCSQSQRRDGNAVAIAAKDELIALCKKLERRLFSEGSRHSTGLDDTPHAADEIRQVVLKNPKTTTITIDYLKDTMFPSFDSLAKLKQSLEQGRRFREMSRSVLYCFRMESYYPSKKYSRTLAKLMEWQREGSLFLFEEIDTKELQELYNQHLLLETSLNVRKREIKKKKSSSKKWRKIWKVTYTITFMAILTCSVVLAALTLPPAAITAATVSATALKAIEPYFDSMWDKQKKDLESEKEVIKTMLQRVSVAGHEMESIQSIVDKLKIDIGSVMESVKFVVSEGEKAAAAVEFGVADVRRKMKDVEKGMDELQEKVEWCKGQAQKSAAEVLKVISQEM